MNGGRAPGQIQNVGPDCGRGAGGMPPEILHALRLLFVMHSVHTYGPGSCYLRLAVSEKYDVWEALASRLCSSHVRECVH